MSEVIDLTGLVAEPIKVKLWADLDPVEIVQPELATLLELAQTGAKLQAVDTADSEGLASLSAKLEELIHRCVPVGRKLSTVQSLRLMEIIIEKTMPSDLKGSEVDIAGDEVKKGQ